MKNGGARPKTTPALDEAGLAWGWFALAALPFAALMLTRQVSVDYFYHTRFGRLILQLRQIPTHDLFSFTCAGKFAYPHEWLSDVLIYLAESASHVLVLVLLKILAPVAALALTYWHSFKRSGSVAASLAAATLACLLLRVFADVRPLTLSWVFIAYTYALLFVPKARPASWWSLPPLALLWANMHGSAPAGLGLMLLKGLDEAFAGWRARLQGLADEAKAAYLKLQHLAWPALAVLAALMVNPQGPALLVYPLKITRDSAAMNFIIEWCSPDFHQAWSKALLVAMLVTCLAFAYARRRPSDYLLVAGTWLMALEHQRHTPLVALLLAPLWAEGLARLVAPALEGLQPLARRAVQEKVLVLLVVGLVCFSLGANGQLLRTSQPLALLESREAFPSAACDWLQEAHLPGHGFNIYFWGGYLIYRLWPEYKVFVDGRADLYYGGPMEDYVAIHMVHADWKARMAKYKIDYALVPRGYAVATVLEASCEWRCVWQDQVAQVFVRKGSPAERATDDFNARRAFPSVQAD